MYWEGAIELGKFSAKRNYSFNRKIHVDGVISAQYARPACEMHYGLVSTRRHGSGWVSVYNVLWLLTRNVSPAKIIRSLENVGGTVLGGLWGTKLRDLISVLSEYGYSSQVYIPGDGDKGLFPVGATGILVYRTARWFGENRYVAFRKLDHDSYEFFNPASRERSLEAFLNRQQALRGARALIIRKPVTVPDTEITMRLNAVRRTF